MNYTDVLTYLSREMGVEPIQITLSLSSPVKSGLRSVDLRNARYEPLELDAADFRQNHAGKIPIKLYELAITDGAKKRVIHIYTHKVLVDSLEKIVVTTSKKMPSDTHAF